MCLPVDHVIPSLSLRVLTHQVSYKVSVKPAHSKLSLPSAKHIKPNRGHQHAALDHVLRPVFNIQKRHAVVEARENQRAEDRAEHSSSSAHQARAADHA